MGYRTKIFKSVKIDLDEGYWVKIKPLTKDEEDDCVVTLLETSFEGLKLNDLSDAKARMNNKGYSTKQLVAGIVEWNLDDDDGKILPINEETVSELSGIHSSKIIQILRGVTVLGAVNGTVARQDLS